jgi:osmotically-inducible protein OsmY
LFKQVSGTFVKVLNKPNNRYESEWRPTTGCSERHQNAVEIGVIAKNGVITLTGTVNSYARMIEAKEAAKNVGSVKAAVEKSDVRFGGTWRKDDNDIATEVDSRLRGSTG